ncbi:hypothetical protein FNU79_01710 [Deinococcus detaillensis]|uniref:Uncharacterized protein n=1 Tax=Deinococcus detaillensis TaxID=2592048 RepID=A0A553V6D2_9DEIO|nr:hypothetical protein [Deinococcus detaillensis]TSA87984.1 hypothetical protein FNU79_01710 [Deinococcus detaillensis]
MPQEMLNILTLPLLFSTLAGLWIYRHRPEQRPQLLLSLCSLFVVSAYGYSQQPQPVLFGLLLTFMVMLCSLLLHHWDVLLLPVKRK